jgi:hypothetical protein
MTPLLLFSGLLLITGLMQATRNILLSPMIPAPRRRRQATARTARPRRHGRTAC